MFAIVDYDTGNTRNLIKALDYLKIENKLTDDPNEIINADAVILPGVGAFAAAMAELQKRDLVNVLKQVAANKTPMLGICLGMQLLFDSSEEYGKHTGLGLINGNVKAIPADVKVPQMGWNQNRILRNGPFNIIDQQFTYFVHSYYPIVHKKPLLPGLIMEPLFLALCRMTMFTGCNFTRRKVEKLDLSY